MGCKSWYLTWRKEYRQRGFEGSEENIKTEDGGSTRLEKTA
jgi:hypothetical protein